jgi:hypothetical protein
MPCCGAETVAGTCSGRPGGLPSTLPTFLKSQRYRQLTKLNRKLDFENFHPPVVEIHLCVQLLRALCVDTVRLGLDSSCFQSAQLRVLLGKPGVVLEQRVDLAFEPVLLLQIRLLLLQRVQAGKFSKISEIAQAHKSLELNGWFLRFFM